MTLWPLPGGTVPDDLSDQNFRKLAEEGWRIENEVVLPHVAELPAEGKEGQLLYNEADGKVYYFNGTEWVAL